MENKPIPDTKNKSSNESDVYLKNLRLTETLNVNDSKSKIRANELFQMSNDHPADELAGVCIEDVHYYDFKNVQSINNTGLASLIDLTKYLLQKGLKVQFVNVNEKIKEKITALELDKVLQCS